MKWLFLIVLISCGANKKDSPSSAPNVTNQDSVIATRRCAPQALPAAHVRDEDYLAFPNFGYQGVGRCRGHALLTQKLLLLMRFRPASSSNLNCESSNDSCRTQVRKWLDLIDEGKTVVVPGFSGLAEFSAIPAVKAVMRSRIIMYGSTYMANRLPLPGGDKRSVLVLREAMRRVNLNQLPYLGLSGAQVGDHGVLGYKVEMKEGLKVLCIRDSNIIPAQGREECDNYMYDDQGSVRYYRYARPRDIVSVEITDDEDRRIGLYRRALCSN